MATGKNSRSSRHKAATEQAYHLDEEDDEDTANGSSAGLREVATARKAAATTSEEKGAPQSSPLRMGKVALSQSFHAAVAKHADALHFLDTKVERAKNGGRFSIQFTFGEVEGLGATSHEEYVAFINLLDIMGYNAKYSNTSTTPDNKKSDRFEPQTVIFLDWIPRKK